MYLWVCWTHGNGTHQIIPPILPAQKFGPLIVSSATSEPPIFLVSLKIRCSESKIKALVFSLHSVLLQILAPEIQADSGRRKGMGIQGLLPLLKSIMVPIHIKDLEGCSVAIDTYSWLHKGALSCSTELCKGLPTSRSLSASLSLYLINAQAQPVNICLWVVSLGISRFWMK